MGLARYEGAVLIGGSSTRMGSDKASIDFNGQALVERPLEALSGAERLVFVGGDRSTAAWHDVGWLDDPVPGSGPVGGVISALRAAQEEIVVVLSCDLPFIDRAAVEHLVTGLGIADGCVPIIGGRRQWTTAAWNRSALLTLERAHAAGEGSLRRCAPDLRLSWLLDNVPRRWLDVDTPAELQSALVSNRKGLTG